MNLQKVKNLDPLSLYLYRYNLPTLLEIKRSRELWRAVGTLGLLLVTALLFIYLPGGW